MSNFVAFFSCNAVSLVSRVSLVIDGSTVRADNPRGTQSLSRSSRYQMQYRTVAMASAMDKIAPMIIAINDVNPPLGNGIRLLHAGSRDREQVDFYSSNWK